MFIDARGVPSDSILDTEICIVGGGVAGITLALEFERKGIETCVVEGGGSTSIRHRNPSMRAIMSVLITIFKPAERGSWAAAPIAGAAGYARLLALISRNATGCPIAAGRSS
ncbi:FAD-dependent monooxygenase [Phyllobacterium sp. A18/5-2]|uniref:FAD-dependent monooxygenase n=1 Tax=Phyllobacterium sp. A18/5-2 TaxID=2978392 RepID=UPI003965C27C